MTNDPDNPTQPSAPSPEPPPRERETTKPMPDGPHEVEDAARQELEYPEDETNEG